MDFVCAGVGLPSVWHELKNPIYLGDENFVNAMQNTDEYIGDLKEIPKIQHRLPQTVGTLCKNIR